MDRRPWWCLVMAPDPESGVARPELGGVPLSDQAAVEVLVGGAAVRGRLVLSPGARSALSVTFTRPGTDTFISSGQITTLLLPSSGAFLRTIKASDLPQAQVRPHAIPTAQQEAQALAASVAGEDLGLADLAEELAELGAAMEEAADQGPVPLVRDADGHWTPLVVD